METNIVPYKIIVISIFPNGEKLEATWISDAENEPCWKMLTIDCQVSEQSKFHDCKVRIQSLLRMSSHTDKNV